MDKELFVNCINDLIDHHYTNILLLDDEDDPLAGELRQELRDNIFNLKGYLVRVRG